MKKSNWIVLALSVFGAFSASLTFAQDFSVQFKNPHFGGNPFNGTFLLGAADAQRTATASTDTAAAAAGSGAIPGIGGAAVGGPTIIIPIGNLGASDLTVGTGGTSP
ncbi:curli assembly protein CsgF [uncultured Tateyamaria sp.]|uniref:curli assembly protein CsgF n=1 Tax=uncultured Tateyamaria sp. TaxID=455651 RepID=UPI00261E2B2C|nr:curli assembly protein CsgF [uncultured Tateyamaria sp.]